MNFRSLQLNKQSPWFNSQITFVLAFIIMLAPFSIDTFLPAITFIKNDLKVSYKTVELILTTYLLGYALGQFTGGYTADRIGRKLTAIIGLSIYLVGSFLILISKDIYFILSMRFIQAIGGGFTTVVCMAIARDLFSGKELAKRLSLIAVVVLAAPMVAPVVGTFLSINFQWRSIFGFLTAYCCVSLIIVLLFIPKTQKEKVQLSPMKVLKKVISHRNSMANIFTGSFCFAAMFSFITDSNFFYIDFYKQPTTLFPFYFSCNVLFMIIAAFANSIIVKRIGIIKMLIPSILVQLGGILFLFLSFRLGFSSFWLSFSCIGIFMGTNGFIYGNTNAAAFDYFGNISASAAAVSGLLRSGIGSLASFLVTRIRGDTPENMVLIMLSCSLIASFFYFVVRDSKKL